MSIPVFNLIVAICMMVITLFIIAWAVGMLIAVFQVRNILRKTSARAEPAIAKAEDAIGTVNSMVHTVQQRVEGITTTAEATVEVVSRRIKGTTEVITETAASPFITLSSLVTGISRGLEVYSSLKKRTGGMRRAA